MNPDYDLPILLAASPGMKDPNFEQSVILLLEHDENGALGFIINNKSHMTMKEVVAFDKIEIPPEIPVWFAGPVDSSAGFVLHNQKNDYFEREVAPGISLSASQESLKKLVDSEVAKEEQKDRYPFRLLIGYAGWGPGQLESEFRQGLWIKAPLDRQILFNSDYQEIWTSTLNRIGIDKNSMVESTDYSGDWLH